MNLGEFMNIFGTFFPFSQEKAEEVIDELLQQEIKKSWKAVSKSESVQHLTRNCFSVTTEDAEVCRSAVDGEIIAISVGGINFIRN